MAQNKVLETGKGTATIGCVGGQVTLFIEQVDDGQGLYKGYIRGAQGQMDVGTLMPQGGKLVLHRKLGCATLECQGLWPILGVGARLAYATPPVLKGGLTHHWRRDPCPKKWMKEEALAQSIDGVSGAMVRTFGTSMALALPWRSGEPFPVPPLFCLGCVRTISEKSYLVFAFDRQGQPILPPPEE